MAVAAAIDGHHVAHAAETEAQEHPFAAAQRRLPRQTHLTDHKTRPFAEGTRRSPEDLKDVFVLKHAGLTHQSDLVEHHLDGDSCSC